MSTSCLPDVIHRISVPRPSLCFTVLIHVLAVKEYKITNEGVSIMLRSGVQCWITVLERVILCVVFAVGPLPPMSTSHPPDVIHVINAPSPLVFFAGLPLPCIIMNTNERYKWGRPGNKARE